MRKPRHELTLTKREEALVYHGEKTKPVVRPVATEPARLNQW